MSVRALIIGILAALFIAGAGYVNDWILDLERFNSGHLLPIMVIGPLLVFAATVNALLVYTRRWRAFSGAELAVVFVLTSTACSVPGRSLMEHFTQVLVMPLHWYRVNPGWKDRDLIRYFPEHSFVEAGDDDRVISGYVTGLSRPEDRNLTPGQRLKRRVSRVPWAAWKAPLVTWLPIVLVAALCYACLALVLHRQWSEHEHLAYPIAQFVTAIIRRPHGSPVSTVLRSRWFWVGLSLILAVRVNNGLHRWFPEVLIPVTLHYRFTPFMRVFPGIANIQWGYSLLHVDLFPLVVAFAFLLSTEVSLTMGLSQVLWAVFAIPLISAGVDLYTDYGTGGWSGWQRGGSYIAFAIMLLYTGRQYYGQLIRGAFTSWRRPDGQSRETWAMRLLIAGAIALTALIAALGVPVVMAALLVVLGLLSCVVVSRISAETGLFFIHPRWQPFAFVVAMLGGYVMNPSVLAASVMACFMFSIDQSQAFLPYLTNGLKVCEQTRVRLGRMTWTTLAVYAAGVGLAVVVALVATYDAGTPGQCRWSYTFLPKMPFLALDPEVLKLQALGLLEAAETLPWYAKLGGLRPKPGFLWAAGFGFAAVVAFSVLRLRLPRWPLHPVLFLVWMTWPMVVFSYSILLGWLIKKLVLRFGGQSLVQRLRPLMFGIIGGEILGALVFMVVGTVYFLVTGKPPVSYRYFPR